MRNIKKFIFGLSLVALGLVSCDQASQEVSPIVSPDDYPTVTFEQLTAGTAFNEGTTLVYRIKLSKPIDRSLTFNAKLISATASEEEDFIIKKGIIAPFTTETTVTISFEGDKLVEADEKFKIEIGLFSLAEKYLVNPKTVNPVVEYTVKNVNDPTLLTVNFAWDTKSDIDIVTWSNTVTYPMEPWGTGGATGNNPEVDQSIWLADPAGTYYVSIISYGEPSFNYTFTVGHPDGTVQTFKGKFDADDLTKYTADLWPVSGFGNPDAYRMLKVENDGTKFVVTAL